MSKESELKVVDWAGAMRQVSDDRAFLDEVMEDLMLEADTAQNDLQTAVSAFEKATVAECEGHFAGTIWYCISHEHNHVML